MTNDELIDELNDARAKREALYEQFISLDESGAAVEEIAAVERVVIEHEEDIKHLMNEVNYRLNSALAFGIMIGIWIGRKV